MSKKNDIVELIKKQINSKKLSAGTKLKPEKELASKLNVSRTTLRLALSELENEGLIERKVGDGTYIKNNDKSKYIILAIPDIFSKNDIFYTFQYMLAKMKNLLKEAGYKTFVYNRESEEDFFSIINIKPEEIELWISITIDKPLPEITACNIPIIDVLSLTNYHYSVSIDFDNLFQTIDSLIEKHSLKKPLIFIMGSEDYKLINLDLYKHGVIEYFRKKYNVILINGDDYTSEERFLTIKEALIENKDTCDSIVFTDDTFYKAIMHYTNAHKELLQGKKIITHSNYPDTIIYPENFCRLEFNLDTLSDEIMKFIDKLKNKEYIASPIITKQIQVINEDALK
ncbi:MAG: GntR family transcriptional regulator [Armatimonadetes bacterium]|nr:GntR family transcriptional regulator [Candidatus Hippobium faecium]